MRDFKELNWSEGTEAVMALASRLTVMRGMLSEGPLKELRTVCGAVIDGNVRLAAEALYNMTGEMLTGNCRRVTGDLFKDLLLDALLIKPHPFAKMAAANRIDEAVYNAMRNDLDLLASLNGLDGETLYRFILERYRDMQKKLYPAPDLAERRAVAAWGGGIVRPPEEAMPPLVKLPTFMPADAPSWHYGEEELRDSFVSDEALEEMYHRFIESEMEWSSLTEDLWNFFASYGSGEFLRVRRFIWDDGRLAPIDETRLPAESENEKEAFGSCLSGLIGFMRGDSAEPYLHTDGEPASLLFTAADELPELRIVFVPGSIRTGELMKLFSQLRDQPLKFAVAFGKTAPEGFPERLIPPNVILAVKGSADESAEGEEW